MTQKNNDAAHEEKKPATEAKSPAATESQVKEVTNPEDQDL